MKIILSGHLGLPPVGLIIIFLVIIHGFLSLAFSGLAWVLFGYKKREFQRIFLPCFFIGLIWGLLSVGILLEGSDRNAEIFAVLYFLSLFVGIGVGISRKKRGKQADEKKYKMKIELQNEDQLSEAAKSFLEKFPSSKVFAFHGELGAGKTTFIKAICAQLGVKDAMSSPSFSIVNEYRDEKNNPIYHFDLYRLKSAAETMDIGMEEYLYSGNYCFIEWPEIAEALLPEKTVHVRMREENGKRIVEVDL